MQVSRRIALCCTAVRYSGGRLFLTLLLALSGCAQLQGAPPDGHYAGELCVAVGSQQENCGRAELWLSNEPALVRIQVSDIVYRLSLHDGELELELMHGAMQVDSFRAAYKWLQRVLHFVDAERRVHYRVRFANPIERPE